jgi:release factor glutamine methyltransferase
LPNLDLLKRDLAAALLAAGIESGEARREAELIVEHVTGLSLAQQVIQADNSVSEEQQATVQRILKQRQARVPLQFCFGYAHFMGLKLAVRPGVFIPRGDTETLVQVACSRLKSEAPVRLADVGTGSGAIAIAVLKLVSTAIVTAIDISPEAVALTKENAMLHGVWQRVRLVHSDWRSALPTDLDAILSNPPYIPRSDRSLLEPEVVEHEPELALFGGDDDGLSFYRELSTVGQSHLRSDGWIALEVGDRQSASVQAVFQQAGWKEVEIVADLNGLPRVLTALKAD